MQIRRSIPNHMKIQLLKEEASRDSRQSLREFCRANGIQPSQIRRWKKMLLSLGEANGTARTICKGRASSLVPIEEDLVKWIMELRESGLAVSTRMVKIKASELQGSFRAKSNRAKDQCIRRFLAAHRFAIQLSTHELFWIP